MPHMAKPMYWRRREVDCKPIINVLSAKITKCFLKTQLGPSKVCFSHSRQSPVFGMGQGGAAAPTIWGVVGSWMFDVLQTVLAL